jgi:outer membrane cobalamin receptor
MHRRSGVIIESVQIVLQPGLIERDFTLESTPLRLGEVVVTGAGTVKPVERLGTVRNTVSAETVDWSNEQNIVQALAGKAPNVEVTQRAGEPGASSSICIRGLNTIQGNRQPLFVVDGIPI